MNLVAEDGIDPVSGKKYEFVQKSLKMNHAALVSAARAGKEARIFDNKPKVQTMKITLTDGVSVEFAHDSDAQLVKSAFDSLQKRLVDAEKKAEDMEEEKEKAEVAKDMAEAEKEKTKDELEKEKEKTTDSSMAKRVGDAMNVLAKAKSIAGKEFTCDSFDIQAIKVKALSDAFPKVDWKDKSAAVIEYAFDEKYEEKAEDEDEEEKEKANDSFRNLGMDSQSVSVKDAQSIRDENYRKFCAGEKI